MLNLIKYKNKRLYCANWKCYVNYDDLIVRGNKRYKVYDVECKCTMTAETKLAVLDYAKRTEQFIQMELF